ncbi:hypothetical protein GE061_007777 [Apolygus lucorum]|uniref:BESS domain-containing protein n=1 Tax=Apolygus lucorum TaxID=248454 RepID=A0A8S9WMC3_APOLU|nr:hypothetical protein GE061_007777 [Apolygus lucorum]
MNTEQQQENQDEDVVTQAQRLEQQDTPEDPQPDNAPPPDPRPTLDQATQRMVTAMVEAQLSKGVAETQSTIEKPDSEESPATMDTSLQLPIEEEPSEPSRPSTSFSAEYATPNQKKKKKSDLDSSLLAYMREPIDVQPPDDHESFFESLLPIVRKFNDDQTLEFRTEVLNLASKIRRKGSLTPGPPFTDSASSQRYGKRNTDHLFEFLRADDSIQTTDLLADMRNELSQLMMIENGDRGTSKWRTFRLEEGKILMEESKNSPLQIYAVSNIQNLHLFRMTGMEVVENAGASSGGSKRTFVDKDVIVSSKVTAQNLKVILRFLYADMNYSLITNLSLDVAQPSSHIIAASMVLNYCKIKRKEENYLQNRAFPVKHQDFQYTVGSEAKSITHMTMDGLLGGHIAVGKEGFSKVHEKDLKGRQTFFGELMKYGSLWELFHQRVKEIKIAPTGRVQGRSTDKKPLSYHGFKNGTFAYAVGLNYPFQVMDENDVVLATLHGEVTSINIEGSPTTLSTTPAQQETVVSSSDDACDTRLSHVVVRRTLQTIIQLEQELATLMEDQERPDFARMAELEARLDELYDALYQWFQWRTPSRIKSTRWRLLVVVVRWTLQTIIQLEQELATLMEDQ